MRKKLSLTDFKRFLESAKHNQIHIKTKVLDKYGKTIKEDEYSPVIQLQTHSFAVQRKTKIFWYEYGRAKDWEFDNGELKKVTNNGGRIVFNFQEPTFFSHLLQ